MAGFFGSQEIKTDKLLVCLDLGSHKIKAIAALENKSGKRKIIGLEEIDSDGIKRGVIINPSRVSALVRKLIGRLESKIDHHIKKVYVSTGGMSLIVKRNNVYRLPGGTKQFSSALIDEMEEENHRLFDPQDTEILLVEPLGFKIDNEIEVKHAVGSVGQRIDGTYLVIAAKKHQLDVLRNTLSSADLTCEITPAGYASSVGVLSNQEMEVGAVVLDIGAGVSQLAVYQHGQLAHLAVIPFAGNSITNDLKQGWNIQFDQAEKLKCGFGSAMPEMEKDDHYVSLTGVRTWSDKMVQMSVLSFVIEARLEEMFSIFNNIIEGSGFFETLGTGIILTGGSSKIKNLVPFVKKNIGLDACVSTPVQQIEGTFASMLQKPEYAILLGLLSEADEDCEKKEGFSFFTKAAPKKQAPAKRKTSTKDLKDRFTGSLFESPRDVSFDD